MALVEICLLWLALYASPCHSLGEARIVVRDAFHTKFPIALTDDFWTLIKTSSLFADKTDFIINVVSHPAKVLIFARPPKWGKSINLSMLRYFLQIQTNKEGMAIEYHSQTNVKFFKFGDVIEDGKPIASLGKLKVSSDYTAILQNLARYPVIFLNFSGIAGNNSDDVVQQMRHRIAGVFDEYKYAVRVFENILTSNFSTLNEKTRAEENLAKYDSLLNARTDKMQLTESIRFLSETLQMYFGMSVSILIDDYDAPVSYISLSQSDKQQKEEFHVFYQHFLTNTFKSNQFLRKGVLTAVLPLFDTDYFHVYRGAAKYTTMDNRFAYDFGFSEAEVDSFFELMSVPPSLRQLLFEQHRGYRLGTNSSLSMYNPQTIAYFLASEHLNHGALNAKYIEENFFNALKVILFREKMSGFLYNLETPVTSAEMQITVRGLITLSESTKISLKTVNAKYYSEMLIAYMYYYGYLTSSNLQEPPINKLSRIWRHLNQPDTFHLRFATKRVLESMKTKMLEFYTNKLQIVQSNPPVHLVKMFKRFVSNRFQSNVTEVSLALKDFLHNVVGKFRVKKDTVHCLLNYLSLHMDAYDRCVDEFNTKRPDMVLLKDDYLAIIEFTIGRTDAVISPSKYDVIFRKLNMGCKTLKCISINYTPDSDIIMRTLHRHTP